MKITETCVLQDRGIIYINGIDAKDFLQNILTNDLNKISDKQSIFSSLLTAQGKYLFDFILVKHKKGYLIDCEKTELENLIKALKIYKLRSKVEILNLSNEFIVASIPFEKYLTLENNQTLGFTLKYKEDPILLDPRNKKLGARLISKLFKKSIYSWLVPSIVQEPSSSILTSHSYFSCTALIFLPPGPINSPGKYALVAASSPHKTNYFYFVSDGKGRHIFNATYKGHINSK